MGVFEMIAVVVVAGIAYDMYKLKIKSDQQNSSNTELEQQIAQLNRRIETLEKIVTDPSYQLNNEINRL